LTYVALADGKVQPAEQEIICGAYRHAGFERHDVEYVRSVIHECERQFHLNGSDIGRLLDRVHSACAEVVAHSNQEIRAAFFRAALRVASSDRFISSAESEVLRATAEWLGLPPDVRDRIWNEAKEQSNGGNSRTGYEAHDRAREPVATPPDLATYYAKILGVSVSASPHELKRAFRQKAKQYHPDTVSHRGVEYVRQAEERFKEISRAYNFFRGARVT
jgi:DnaJ-domain-containing protein 1